MPGEVGEITFDRGDTGVGEPRATELDIGELTAVIGVGDTGRRGDDTEVLVKMEATAEMPRGLLGDLASSAARTAEGFNAGGGPFKAASNP
jgi:hypothetical protein